MSDEDDDRLLAELGAAVREGDAVPASFVLAAESAFAWRTVDAELARLLDEPVATGVRSAPGGPRTPAFRAGDLGVELEIDAGAVRGQLVPPQPAAVRVRTADRVGPPVPADELGWFVLDPVSERFRLHVRTADGRSVLTDWIAP